MSKRITPRQRLFLNRIAAGDDAATAYKAAGFESRYPAQAASALLRQPHIKDAVDKLRAKVVDDLGVTAEWCVSEFKQLLADAKGTGDNPTAARCIENLGKIAGAYVEKHEDVTSKMGTPEDVAAKMVAAVLEAILPVLKPYNVPAETVSQALLAKFGLQTKPQPGQRLN